MKEGVIEYTMIITDIPDTLDPETLIPMKQILRNGFSTQLGLRETFLKSAYI